LTLPDPQNTQNREWLWKWCSLVRELHIYGKVVWINTKYNKQDVQHTWLGTMLLTLAEEISTYHKYWKISVISWVGVRWFYEKRWYTLEWTYMVKYLS
jgi:histone acetyltransferase (RNA polymerase elongator complex component)